MSRFMSRAESSLCRHYTHSLQNFSKFTSTQRWMTSFSFITPQMTAFGFRVRRIVTASNSFWSCRFKKKSQCVKWGITRLKKVIEMLRYLVPLYGYHPVKNTVCSTSAMQQWYLYVNPFHNWIGHGHEEISLCCHGPWLQITLQACNELCPTLFAFIFSMNVCRSLQFSLTSDRERKFILFWMLMSSKHVLAIAVLFYYVQSLTSWQLSETCGQNT